MTRKEAIYSVDTLSVALEKKNPPNLVLEGLCTTRTPGYTGIELSPRVYIDPPADGIWEFDLIGAPPEGGVPQVLHPDVPFAGRLNDLPAWCMGARVIAAVNEMQSVKRR